MSAEGEDKKEEEPCDARLEYAMHQILEDLFEDPQSYALFLVQHEEDKKPQFHLQSFYKRERLNGALWNQVVYYRFSCVICQKGIPPQHWCPILNKNYKNHSFQTSNVDDVTQFLAEYKMKAIYFYDNSKCSKCKSSEHLVYCV